MCSQLCLVWLFVLRYKGKGIAEEDAREVVNLLWPYKGTVPPTRTVDRRCFSPLHLLNSFFFKSVSSTLWWLRSWEWCLSITLFQSGNQRSSLLVHLWYASFASSRIETVIHQIYIYICFIFTSITILFFTYWSSFSASRSLVVRQCCRICFRSIISGRQISTRSSGLLLRSSVCRCSHWEQWRENSPESGGMCMDSSCWLQEAVRWKKKTKKKKHTGYSLLSVLFSFCVKLPLSSLGRLATSSRNGQRRRIRNAPRTSASYLMHLARISGWIYFIHIK